MSGKGSRPRPSSVDQKTFDSNWDAIFGKKETGKENLSICGCGRSPTGKCIGWHALPEEVYQKKKTEWELAEYMKQAQDLWNDSCTSNRSK